MTTIADPATAEYSARNSRVELLSLAAITPSTINPRKHFDEAALDELAASIRQHGLLQPIVVRPVGDRYSIVAGERRWRAARIAGLTAIAAVIREDLGDDDTLRLALIENLQREDLDPIEEAEGYRRLQESGMRQTAIAAAVNRSQPAVANAMRLLELPEDVRERIRAGELSVSHGVALASLKAFPAVVSRLAELASGYEWSSKEIASVQAVGAHQLTKEGLTAHVPSYEPEAVRKHCLECPFQAYRAGSYGGVCLNPEHLAELRKEVRAAQQAQAAAVLSVADQKAAARAAVGAAQTIDLPLLSSLSYGSYEQIRGTPPAGCSDACECRGAARDRDNARVAICTKPRRYARLVREAEALAQRRREAKHAAVVEAMTRVVDEITDAGPRELALFVAAMGHRGDLGYEEYGYTKAAEDAGARNGLTVLPSSLVNYRGSTPLLDELTADGGLPALRTAIETILRRDLWSSRTGHTDRGAWAAWYLPPAVFEAEPPEEVTGARLVDVLADEYEPDEDDINTHVYHGLVCPGCGSTTWNDGPGELELLIGLACEQCGEPLPENAERATCEVRACRECGCTDEEACDEGCEWVEADLCSACAEGREADDD